MTILVEDHHHSDTELSDNARELVLHGDNTQHLYRTSHIPIVKNLEKKQKKGVYDHEKSKKLWKYHADRAAQSYAREHGHPGAKWHEMFSTKDRKDAASHWADSHHTEMTAGNFHKESEDTAAEIVFAAMGGKPLDANKNFKQAMLERSHEIVEDMKCDFAGKFMDELYTPNKLGNIAAHHYDVGTKTVGSDPAKGAVHLAKYKRTIGIQKKIAGHKENMVKKNAEREDFVNSMKRESVVDEARKPKRGAPGGSWVPQEVADRFKKQAAEKKQFAGAKREIDQLKKKGK